MEVMKSEMEVTAFVDSTDGLGVEGCWKRVCVCVCVCVSVCECVCVCVCV